MASAASDKNVNRVALCSAIFAGVAYVGYSVVRQAFGRVLHRGEVGVKDGDLVEYGPPRRRVYLRRLSGSGASTSTEALLGTLESDDSAARLVFRPLSVQARIKELNIRARHFAETIMALQMQQESRRALTARSLTSLPPLICPIDITHLGSSRCSSVENIAVELVNGNGYTSPGGGACSLPGTLRRRITRRSRRRSRSPDAWAAVRAADDDAEDEEAVVEAEGERLLDEREAELRRRLQGFEEGSIRILTPYEAKSLVALLHAKDSETLEKALVTVANSAAFTTNQDYLREAGCLIRLGHLASHADRSVQVAALLAIANMALNTENQKEMGNVVPVLVPLLWTSETAEQDDHLLQQVLQTLTNVAALSDWHEHYRSALQRLLELTQCDNSRIRMHALRLLVNLSTNEEMVPYILAAKSPDYLWHMLDADQTEAELLRVISFVSNLVCTAHKQQLDPALDLPMEDGTHQPDTLYSHVFGSAVREDVLAHLRELMTTHAHEDIRMKARMVHSVVAAANGDANSRSGSSKSTVGSSGSNRNSIDDSS